MTPSIVRRSALVLSTTPPWPRDFGNRNRVHQTVEFLERLGYAVSFLLYPYDEEWTAGIPDYHERLVRRFEYFAVIPNRIQLHARAKGEHHAIDEWWDETIGLHLQWLFRRKRFDVFWVNYTFMSAALDFAPADCLRLLDTHDQFTGRREMLERNGLEPEFFYTTADQERLAFDRADAVIAIKAAEAEFMRAHTRAAVFCLPYWDARAQAERPGRTEPPAAFDRDRPLRLGFMGVRNTVNSVNLNRFLERFDRWVRLYDLPVRIRLAGTVCRSVAVERPYVETLGRVENPADFYDGIDAVVTPLAFSTGIKIKVGEALAWGLPVFATQNAFDGFSALHPAQSAGGFDELCEIIADVATNQTPLAPIARAAEGSAQAAARAQEQGFVALSHWLEHRARRILVISARSFWRRSTFAEEQLAQAIEFASRNGRVIVISTASGPVQANRVLGNFDRVQVGPAEVEAALAAIAREAAVTDLLIADAQPDLRPAASARAARLWTLRGAGSLTRHADGVEPTKTASLLRYLPEAVARTRPAAGVAICLGPRPTAWESAVAAFVAAAAGLRGTKTQTIEPPDDCDDDAAFYAGLCSLTARRIVFVGDWRGHAWALQIARYREGMACLIVTPQYVAPQALAVDGRASLADSIAAFLDGEASVGTAGWRDGGWSALGGGGEGRPSMEPSPPSPS